MAKVMEPDRRQPGPVGVPVAAGLCPELRQAARRGRWPVICTAGVGATGRPATQGDAARSSAKIIYAAAVTVVAFASSEWCLKSGRYYS
jgi:hypothetical protein